MRRRCLLLRLTSFPIILAGCGSSFFEPADYGQARAACGIEEDGWNNVRTEWGDWGSFSISEACAEQIGSDFGVDWNSFDDAPHDIDPEQEWQGADRWISSVFLVLAADLGSSRSLLHEADTPR